MKHFSYSAFKQNINMHWMYSTLQCGWKQKWCYFHSNCILLTVISHECLSCTEQSDKAFRSHVYELTFMWGGWGEGGRQDSRETTVPDGFSTFGSAQPLVIIIRRHQDLFFFFFLATKLYISEEASGQFADKNQYFCNESWDNFYPWLWWSGRRRAQRFDVQD